ncbi:MAG: PP2C family protein-serine/threonine phosphatase [Candidatus Rokuibacteriota bacterium]
MNNARVLVVDDEVDISTILTLTLRRAGFQVTAASDGIDGLRKLAEHTPDLVVLDVMMPHLDGLEMLRRIRAEPATSALPVIMLTARAQVADRLVGFEHGADDYVAKPFEPNEVVARVRALLRRTEQARLTRPLLGLLGAWSSAEGLAQLQRDLETTREIQARLIPAVAPRLGGLQTATALRPSMIVGGDFFDVVPMGDLIGVVVGDVSGKGIPAALLMVMVRTLLREIANGLSDPATVLARLNASLCRDMPPSMFVTALLSVLDPSREGVLQIANGGHPAPILMRRGHAPVAIDVDGAIIGAFADARFGQAEIRLEPGDTLVLVSDGALETPDRGGRRSGLAGLISLLEKHCEVPPAQLVEAIVANAVNREGAKLRDDVTVFALRR